jgi:hypothetical protein
MAGLMASLGWLGYAISLFLFVQFFVYEYVEETKIHDEMFHELREWTFSFVAGLVTHICMQL